jgi:protein associated with RNAse G/E
MITVIKQSPRGEPKIQYAGEIIERLHDGAIIQAYWQQPAKDLGYTRFEPGDSFIEYYYTDKWFNIFDIATASGRRKGWYCNVAEPASISGDIIKQIDLLLDVWVDPTGKTLILDEDEFQADTTLSDEQRKGAQQGLQQLLELIAERGEPFSQISL